MKIYLFSSPASPLKAGIDRTNITNILHSVAENTETQELVTALYLLPGRHQTRGTAYVRGWMNPKHFVTGRGHWACTRSFALPGDLPEKFKLIRLRLDANPKHYPREERDVYHWTFQYPTFEDHLANLFSHELHHFRRFHLNLHPGEGEQRANRWALEHCRQLGFDVEGKRETTTGNRKNLPGIFRLHPILDPFRDFRDLKPGHRLIIHTDPKGRYAGQQATLKKRLHRNAKRLVIETTDGRQWRWPMQWLKPDAQN